jgi:hypothetical protein
MVSVNSCSKTKPGASGLRVLILLKFKIPVTKPKFQSLKGGVLLKFWFAFIKQLGITRYSVKQLNHQNQSKNEKTIYSDIDLYRVF